jgi:stage V sporulation protein K
LKNKRNPFSFLEDSFSTLKGYLEGEQHSAKEYFTSDFIDQLQVETTNILSICHVLNQDDAFIQKINSQVNHSFDTKLLIKAEHFFLSDLLILTDLIGVKESEKSQFTVAYYYDALRNKHFADVTQVGLLNKLVTSGEFKVHLNKIKHENRIPSVSTKSNYLFMTSTLLSLKNDKVNEIVKHAQKFIDFSHSIKLSKERTNTLFELDKVITDNKDVHVIQEEDTLEKVLKELNQLIGLKEVKKNVSELVNLLEIQKKRTAQGLKNIDISLHTVFLGPPGTGKTTVARLLSRIFKHLGFVSKGQLYETDREGMIAGFVGQTATKVDKVVQESLGGVLFIDEAYALTQNSLGNDYGAEAVNTLLKRMEDHREDFVVVVAGYTEPMKFFIESNPGLRSRFNRFFKFEHFTPSELIEIFESYCKNSDFILNEEAKEKLNDTIDLLYDKKDETFGNARVMRNIFEICAQNQANRIVKLSKLTQKVLKTLTEEDIPEPKETLKQLGIFEA